ncbi:MAG: polysaccharide deacetylase family protein [Chloroflexota bacterium]
MRKLAIALTALFASALLSIGSVQPTLAASGSFELHVPVLYYHRIRCYPVGVPSKGDYTCPAAFQAQMTALVSHGWKTITIDRLADLMHQHNCPPRRTLVVSFDDGSLDNYEVAAPILESLGMRGSFLVNPGRVGQPNRMSFDQMRDLLARGHAIGNHRLTHLSLPNQPPETLYAEIEGAQQLLQQNIGFRPRTFAYPYGRYGKKGPQVMDQVRASGFELAFTVVRGARESSNAPLLSRRLRTSTQTTDRGCSSS